MQNSKLRGYKTYRIWPFLASFTQSMIVSLGVKKVCTGSKIGVKQLVIKSAEISWSVLKLPIRYSITQKKQFFFFKTSLQEYFSLPSFQSTKTL